MIGPASSLPALGSGPASSRVAERLEFLRSRPGPWGCRLRPSELRRTGSAAHGAQVSVLLLLGSPSPFSTFGPSTHNTSDNGHAIAAYVRPAILRLGMAESTAVSPGAVCGRREPTGRLVQWLVDLV